MRRRQSSQILGMYRSDGTGLVPLDVSPVEYERIVQSWAELAPTIVGESLLIIGSKLSTPRVGELDILAMDSRGVLHVIELKRGAGTRHVVSQIVSYESWAVQLSRKRIREAFARYRPGVPLEAAFLELFGQQLPEDAGSKSVLTIVAERLDRHSEDQITYMRDRGFRIGLVLFTRYADRESDYVVFTRRTEHALDSDKRLKRMQQRADRKLGSKLAEFRELLVELRGIIQVVGRGEMLTREPAAPLPKGVDPDVLHFWLEHRWRWRWDFLPSSFLAQLYEHWSRVEAARGHLVATYDSATFGKKLREVAEAYGGWEYRQRYPRTSLDAVEPYTKLIPGWSKPAPDAVTVGYTRAGTTW